MNSRDDGEPDPNGSTMAGDDLDRETLELAREELRITFDYQVERIQEIDEKAIEILKANLLLIGLVVTGGSIVVQTQLDVDPFINPFTIASALLLLASTGLAGVTYTASNLRGGIDGDAVDVALATARADPAADADRFEVRLLRSYGRWIEYNARVTAVNDMFATITVLMVIAAFVYVVAGIAVGAVGPSPIVSGIAFLVLTAVLLWLGAFAYYMDHLGASDSRWEGTFDGVRISKGVTRKGGLSTLRSMRSEGATDEAEAETERDATAARNARP
ncbi:hypothetical protein [Natrinema pallidum]|uniref:Uncharacterized protein n=1 Tax=Natrinema pallidum DSM 3751 TaxID=1227495 RepID=L9YSQ7_9EURY|nr:hypothetical protein [Natrinema pallidum]ELY75943.1 hypothetical protein C487_12598 [Natrinema pallidum DSM 3751]